MSMDIAIRIPNAEEFVSNDDYRDMFNRECAAAFKRVYQLQRLKTKQLAAQVVGVKSAVWAAYGQQSYIKNRSLHLFAVFSWITQVPIEALCVNRRKLSGSEYWQAADRCILEIITYAATLNSHEFACFIRAIQKKIELQGGVLNQQILEQLKALADIGDDFLAPAQIDIEAFKADYYRSISFTMKSLREFHQIPQAYIAELMGESLIRYQAYEDPDNPVSIPLYGVMRVLSVFKIQQTFDFITEMQTYPQFIKARQVQAIRSKILLALIVPLPDTLKMQMHAFVRQLFEFYKA